MKEENRSKKIIRIVLIVLAVLIVAFFLLVMFSDDEEDAVAEEEATTQEQVADAEDADTEDVDTEDADTEDSGAQDAGPKPGKKEIAIKESRAYGDPDTSWTVMLYLCGTDLESGRGYATYNLEEVLDTDISENINFVIEAGGTKKWETEGIPGGRLSRLHVEDGELVLDENCPLASMGQADTLKDFIEWGAASYPADRYMLILWDHGGGSLFGICNDELHDGESLSLKELRTALAGASVPFEVAGFDACLMSTLETAEALQGYAHYMVASEETEPGTGWDYTGWLEHLSENEGCSGKELGQAIVDSYMEKCAVYEQEEMSTLSVCDLTKLPDLSAAFRNYSGELVLSTQNENDFQAVIQGASRSESYGERSGEDGTFDMVDLGDLMKNTGGVLKENSGEVLKSLADVVVYESHGRYRSRASGLSVFYPKYMDDDVYEAYEEITDNTAYLEYASIMNDDWDQMAWNNAWQEAYEEYNDVDGSPGGFFNSIFGFGDDGYVYDTGEEYEEEEPEEGGSEGGFYGSFFGGGDDEGTVNLFQNLQPIQSGGEKVTFVQYLDEGNILNLNIESGLGLVKDVRFNMLYDQDGENYLYMGSDTDINADYENGKFSDNFRGTWITIGGEYVCADVIDTTDDYDLYIIPALVNGEETFIRAVYEFDKEAFKVLGTYDGADSETNLSGRNIHSLKPGDKVDFIFYSSNITSDEDEDPEEIVLGSITWSEDTKMTDEELGDGRFYYTFEIEDVFGNVIYSDPVLMEIKDGETYAYEID